MPTIRQRCALPVKLPRRHGRIESAIPESPLKGSIGRPDWPSPNGRGKTQAAVPEPAVFQNGSIGQSWQAKPQIEIRAFDCQFAKEAIDTLVLVMLHRKVAECAMAANALLDCGWAKPAVEGGR